jgi:hypothetical protein
VSTTKVERPEPGAVAGARYRFADGVPCIDVRAQRIEQLFDNRDPAPFRERDLDPEVAEYLLAAAEDLGAHDTLEIVFWLEHEAPASELAHAFRGHFEDVLARLRRQRRRSRRIATVTLLLASVLVLVLFTAAQLVGAAVPGSLGAALKEGLVISCWVVLWRPVELLVYGWVPVRQERRVVERILRGTLSVRTGKPPVQAYPS